MKTVLLPTKGEWKTATLGEVCSDVFSGGTPKTSENGYYGGDIPWLRTQEVNFNYIEDTELKITEEGFKNSSAQWTPANTVIIAMYGNSAGRSAFSRIPLTTNQACCNLIVNKEIANPLFVYFAVKNQYKSLESLANGGAQQNLNASIVKNFVIPLPPLSEQEGIVKILSSLDDKIELLRQQNETLEQIARTAFDEWFEKSTSDGVLPDGWRIYNVADIADVISGYSYKGADLVESSTDALVNLKNFDRNGGFKTDGMKPLHGSPKKNHEVQLGDLIVAHTDLTQDAEVLGNAALVMEKAGFEHLYISMDVAKVIPKTPLSAASLYFLMTTRRFKQHCVGYANGTTVLHLPRVAVPQYMVVLPADLHSQILSDFNLLAQATTQGIASNLDKIQTLTKIRDLLLPRLMNGEVCVQE